MVLLREPLCIISIHVAGVLAIEEHLELQIILTERTLFGRGEGTGEVRASFAATGRQWCTREPGTRKFSGSELA